MPRLITENGLDTAQAYLGINLGARTPAAGKSVRGGSCTYTKSHSSPAAWERVGSQKGGSTGCRWHGCISLSSLYQQSACEILVINSLASVPTGGHKRVVAGMPLAASSCGTESLTGTRGINDPGSVSLI